MGLFEIIALSVGLAMDAFAVAACQGLAMRKVTFKKALTVGLYFGVFQAAMPLIGYFVAFLFEEQINAFDHWIAFGLLTVLGVKMIWESRKKEEAEEEKELTLKHMLPLALATSIDAMAVGVTFALSSEVNVAVAVTYIGVITLAISMAGVKIGSVFGNKFKFGAELAGGVILILIGVKILVEDLFL